MIKHIGFFKITEACILQPSVAQQRKPKQWLCVYTCVFFIRSLHTVNTGAELHVPSMPPRFPEAVPSLGTSIRSLGTCKINPVGEKHRFPSHGAAPTGLTARPVYGLPGFAWAEVKLSPAEQRARGSSLWATRSCLLASCLLKHSAWFSLQSQLSAGSANSELKGMDAPGGQARALDLAQKGTGRIIPWAVPQTTGEPQLPPAPCWTELCSEQLQASSTQQMSHHQSQP